MQFTLKVAVLKCIFVKYSQVTEKHPYMKILPTKPKSNLYQSLSSIDPIPTLAQQFLSPKVSIFIILFI
jgi:hypothetical protein